MAGIQTGSERRRSDSNVVIKAIKYFPKPNCLQFCVDWLEDCSTLFDHLKINDYNDSDYYGHLEDLN